MDFNLNDLVYISKDDILTRISEKDIFNRYLGICPKDNEIGKTIFKSPLREDNKPTCNFYYNKNKSLMFKDHGSDYGRYTSLSCFNVVEYLYNCTYNESLKIVASDFGLIADIELSKLTKKVIIKPKNIYDGVRKKISVITRPYSKTDINYWNEFGISLKTLKLFNVEACQEVYIDNELIFCHMNNQPIYSYKFKDKYYKIYRPKSEYGKWTANSTNNVIQGYTQRKLLNSNKLIITKSLKDVMMFYELGIPSIAPQSENSFINKDILDILFKEFKTIYINFDRDKTGLKYIEKNIELYPKLKVFLVPDKYKSKDFTDLYKEIGELKIKEIIKELL